MANRVYTGEGQAWSTHVLPYDQALEDAECGYDHVEIAVLRVPEGQRPRTLALEVLLPAVTEWARVGGLCVDEAALAEAFASTDLYGEARVERFIDACGFESCREIPPLFDWNDAAWHECMRRARRATLRLASQRWMERDGEEASELKRGDLELVQFQDMVSISMFGGGCTHADLATAATKLLAMSQPIEARGGDPDGRSRTAG